MSRVVLTPRGAHPEDDGSIRVVPVVASPVQAFRGQGRRGGATARLLTDRELDRNAEL